MLKKTVFDGRREKLASCRAAFSRIRSQMDSIEGYGTLDFFSPLGGFYHSGTGDFLDSGIKSKRYTLTMEKISEDFVKNLIGHKDIKNEDEIRNIVKAMLKSKQGQTP